MTREQATQGCSHFVLPYYLSNNGDGSASMHECTSIQEAEEKDEEQSEGWGESSAAELDIYVKDGMLYWLDTVYERVGKKLVVNYVLNPLTKVK